MKEIAAAVREGYAVLLTTDQNLRYQQHLPALPLGVVVLLSTSWPRLRAVTGAVRSAVESVSKGAVVEVAAGD